MLKQLDKVNFQSTLQENDVVLVDFYADWCGPCRALQPALESLAGDFEGKVLISKVNVDEEPELATAFGVRSIPALYYFKKGELVVKQAGLQSKTAMALNLDQLIHPN